MLGLRLDRILGGSALALVLATAAFAGPDGAGTDGAASVESRIPVPVPAEVTPPTRADLGPVAAPDPRQGAVSAAAPTSTAAPDAPSSPENERAQTPGSGPMPASSAAEVAPPGAEPAVTGTVTESPGPGTASPAAAPAAAVTSPPGQISESPPNVSAEDASGTPSKVMPNGSVPAADQNGGEAASDWSPNDGVRDTTDTAPKDAAQDTAGTPEKGTSKDTIGTPSKDAAGIPPKEAVKDNGRPIAAGLAAADVPIAEKLRDILGAKVERIFERRNERTAVGAFYAARGFAPVWIEGGAASERGKAAITRLRAADTDGLDPSDYPTPNFDAAAGRPDALADAELRLTSAVLTYARHAQIGRVHFSRISADIYYNLVAPDPADVLNRLAKTADVGEALGSYNPPQPGFKALRDKLAEIKDRDGETGPVPIAAGPTIRLGMHDDRVPQLRDRLRVAGDASDTTYDRPLADAVKKFQREHDLSATGNFNTATLEAFNGPRRERVADTIIANMERWRWLPRELGKAYVMVNIPDYTLEVVHDGRTVWRTRIVTGKPSTPTPLLSEPMRYITVNPTWNVPPSIVNNEYLPVLQQDPNALARIGLQVEYNRDGSIHIFQPPGAGNALGRIRFNFPNKFLVYQHDTPDKYLFARERRAFSHGCMRVQDPLKYAEVLLSIGASKEGYTVDRLQRMFGGEEHDINLSPTIPVHVTYQTAFVDDAGKLELREDVYGRDARVLAALRGDERRIADIPVERREPRRQAARLQRPPFPNSAPSFFGWLFR